MVGRLLSYWGGLFSGANLAGFVSGAKGMGLPVASQEGRVFPGKNVARKLEVRKESSRKTGRQLAEGDVMGRATWFCCCWAVLDALLGLLGAKKHLFEVKRKERMPFVELKL